MAPQMSLERAYSLLRQQTSRSASFFRKFREAEEADEDSGDTRNAPETQADTDSGYARDKSGSLSLDNTLMGGDASWVDMKQRTIGTGETGRLGQLHLWGAAQPLERLPSWGQQGSAELPAELSFASYKQTPTSRFVPCSSSSSTRSAAASAAASAALAEAATISSFKSQQAREAARVRFAALSCPSSPYRRDPAAALAIALGDASPAFPLTLSLLSYRLTDCAPAGSRSSSCCSCTCRSFCSAWANGARRTASGPLVGGPFAASGRHSARKHSTPHRGPVRFALRSKGGPVLASASELREGQPDEGDQSETVESNGQQGEAAEPTICGTPAEGKADENCAPDAYL